MPVVAGVALWLITGSLLSLCFAALGPLMMAASFLDAARGRRRERRRTTEIAEAAWLTAESQRATLHDEERRRLRVRYPDAATGTLHSPLRGSDAADSTMPIVLGRGVVPSVVRTTGGTDDRARAFEERVRVLERAPIRVPLGGGVCVRGPASLTAAVLRALAVQLSLRFGPGEVSFVGEGWRQRGLSALPHANVGHRGALRIAVGSPGERAVDADALIWLAHQDAEVPQGITTVVDVSEPRRSTVRTPDGSVDVDVEGLSLEQFEMIARDRVPAEDALDAVPDRVQLGELTQTSSPIGLPAAIGSQGRDAVVVDIVEDGPHAIVTGTTGSGKSELLVTWVTAIASEHGPERVTFVLADFKGGTAFEPLRELPHVVAVITDLDEDGARRGVLSLSAELRRREAVLAAGGVRDIRDSEMPRLVIVVDEFAALLNEHPDLGAVFTDIAARGRALGMHLILGTQRASGVVRDALSANCPLRVSLRVSDSADSRAVIGSDAAAELPGGVAARGLALVRRPQDQMPVLMRVALTCPDEIRAVRASWRDAHSGSSPWLPALPEHLPLADLLHDATRVEGAIPWGLEDRPESQTQPPLVLAVGRDRGVALIGAVGSGRTSALRTLAVQQPDALWIPRDAEQMWDVVRGLAESSVPPPSLVLCDDLDAQIGDLTADYAQQLLQWWDQILRAATGTTFVISAVRTSGPVGRVLDMLPRRGLLRAPSRVEHIAAGGDSSNYDPHLPAGRARIGEHAVQFAWTGQETRQPHRTEETPVWAPSAPITGVVTAGASTAVDALSRSFPGADVWGIASPPDSAPGGVAGSLATRGAPQILVGDAESWQREWSAWQRVRTEGEVLFRVERPVDLRQLAGVRELPPYARQHAGRVWALQGGAQPRRLVLPGLIPETGGPTQAQTHPLRRELGEHPSMPLTRRDRRSGE